jgi:hypothetical protein
LNPKSSAKSKFPLRGRQPTGGAVAKIHVLAGTKPLSSTINPQPADANIGTNAIGSITATLPNYSILVRNAG